MVGIRKHDQGAGKSVYKFVPLVPFDKAWTDEELYKLFNLSKEDIAYIESEIQ